jgi:hypothetical protein
MVQFCYGNVHYGMVMYGMVWTMYQYGIIWYSVVTFGGMFEMVAHHFLYGL